MTPQPETPSLHSRVVKQSLSIRLADEHAEFASMVLSAVKYRLSDETVGALSRTLSRHTHSIESNIDLIRLPEKPIWFEFNEAPRRKVAAVVPKGLAIPARVGILIAPDPNNMDRVVIMTAWDFADETARHSYASASFSLADFSEMAWGARNRYSRDPESSVSRLLAEPHVDIPPGFGREMRVMSEVDDPDGTKGDFIVLVNSARRDVMSEFPFALAALLSLQVSQISEVGDALREVRLPAEPKGFLAGVLPRGFIRRGKHDAPVLNFRTPPSA